MLSNQSEFNNLGGGGFGPGFGGGNGIGGFGLFGLVGLLNGRNGGLFGGNDGTNGNTDVLGILSAISNAKDTTVAEGRNLADAICDSEKTNMQQFYAAAIQAANNTQAIKDQATAFAIVNDKRFDDLSAAGVAQTAAIIAKINQTEVDSLRDQLHSARRMSDSKDIEISIQNTNNNLQAQLQAQSQAQVNREYEAQRRFDAIVGSFNQLNRNTQDIINLGTMTGSGTQANAQTNIK